jgi:hypothetical protein
VETQHHRCGRYIFCVCTYHRRGRYICAYAEDTRNEQPPLNMFDILELIICIDIILHYNLLWRYF